MNFLSFFTNKKSSTGNYISGGKPEYQKYLKNEGRPQFIDVRTPAEFKQGHLKNAVNINIFDPEFLTKTKKYHNDLPVFFYCRSGGRSKKAAKKLTKNGFHKVIDLKGGYKGWVNS